jgi:hypothetical protein
MMHHHIFDSELVHLERVLACAPLKRFPCSYWRDRVEQLKQYPQAPLYRHRIARLARLVAELRE